MKYNPEGRQAGYICEICIVGFFGLLFGAGFFMGYYYPFLVIGLFCGVIILVLFVKDREMNKTHQNIVKLVLPSRVAKHDIEPISNK